MGRNVRRLEAVTKGKRRCIRSQSPLLVVDRHRFAQLKQRGDSRIVDPVVRRTAVPATDDQPDHREPPEVLGDSRLGRACHFDEVGNPAFTISKRLEDRDPPGLDQRGEDACNSNPRPEIRCSYHRRTPVIGVQIPSPPPALSRQRASILERGPAATRYLVAPI